MIDLDEKPRGGRCYPRSNHERGSDLTPTTRYPTHSHLARRAAIGLGVALLALAVASPTATLAAAETKRVSKHSNGLVGKALEVLEHGDGMIEMLLMR